MNEPGWVSEFTVETLSEDTMSGPRLFAKILVTFASVWFLIGFCFTPEARAGSPVTSYTQNADGVTFTLQTGVLQLNVYNSVVRVRYSLISPLPSESSLMVTEKFPSQTSFTLNDNGSAVTIATSTLNVVVNKSTSAITFENLSGATILAEDPTANLSMTSTTVDGLSTYTMQTVFDSPSTEALYGLGNFQDGVMNYKGQNETLDQQNIGGTGAEIGLPMLLSNQGYGILWDTNARSWFYGGDGTDTPTNEYKFQIEAGDIIDYYFMYGPTFDNVISSYRAITGQAPMFPKWAYGLFNSYNAYTTQAQILGVVTGYRSANIPVDTVVQDWNYWDPNPWGSDIMNPTNYPNPAQMLSTMHSQNVHGMISVWGYFAPGSSNYTQLNNIGALYPSGYYDAYNPTARSDYWQQLNTELFSNYGWDAWWLDSDEWDPGFPTCCYDRHDVTTALGPGTLYYNSYPLMHTTGVYTGQRATTSAKRVFILSRSAYPGQQRNAAASWSGDTGSDWPTFARQIPAGLNFSVAGIPYWTTDIGGYEGTNWAAPANNELFTRWFQYGAFCPIFRIHGQGHREIYGTQWSASTQADLEIIDNLRYRLMPYIYSLAGMVNQQGYTIMRPLVMDFTGDPNVYGIANEFMYGPAFLVNPVTEAGATTRSVYLPAGTWYDFWTGSSMTGGQTITASAPIYEIPLFVRAGSIVPMGPSIQYATQSVDPQEVRVYRGANGSFTLYEDESDNYDYEQGTSATIPMTYNDSTGTLTIGARSGSFPGMLASRTFNVVFVQPGYGGGLPVTSTPQPVTYTGSPVSVTFASKSPSTPSALTATAGSGQITLGWNLGASSYNIYRGTSSGGEGSTPIATGVSGGAYVDTGLTSGTTYYYKIAAVNSNGTSGLSNEASATPQTDAPFGGTPWPVPGTVQAENYDTGGEGIAYYVSGVNGTANSYRSDGVDLEVTSDSSGGYDLGWNEAGQWFNYTVNVATAGTYTITFRVSSADAITGALHIANASGANLSGEVNIPATGGYNTWSNVTATVTLPAGRQTLTFFDDGGNGDFNFNYMTFSLSSPAEGPYGGTPWAIPGNLFADDYDLGGQGVAYNVATVNGTDNGWRTTGDGIDLEANSDTVSNGADVGWNDAGQWYKYTVNVSTAGTYTVSFRVTSIAAITSALHIANSSGTNLTGEVNIPNTGGFGTWTNVTATLTLPAGQQTLTLFDDAGAGNYNLNYMTFSSSASAEAPYGGTPAAIPGTVQAENYDTGGQGVAYNVTSTNGTANSYRSDGIDIETTSDTGGGYDLGWTSTGQWFRYTVNVASAGTYTVTFRLASDAAVGSTGGSFHLQNSAGTNLTGSVSVPGSGGWQTWENVTANVTLPVGTQVLEFYQDTGGYNINYMTFASTSSVPAAPTGLTATAGNAQVALAWTGSSGATSYNVYRGTSAGAESSTAIATGITATSYTNTGLTNGTAYYYKVAAVDSAGTSSLSNEASGTPSGGEAPFGGTPAVIPGTVQAENYDTGGQGVAYNVTSINGTANSYRSDGVDLEATTDTGGGYDLGWTSSGQWFKYTVNVSTAGTYSIACRVASGSGGGTFHIQNAGGTNLSGAITVPVTGGWQTWTTVNATVTLPAGQQVLTVWQDSANFNINYLTFSLNGSSAPPAPTGLTATSGNATVSLTWSPSSGATSYNAYRGTTAGGDSSTAIATGLTGTSYTNTGLTNGTTYYYKVAAVNSTGTSGQSNEASATPTASLTAVDQIDCGSSSAVSPFVADEFFSAGNEFSSTATINTSGVTNAAPAAVYQTVRWNSSFTYTIPNLTAGSTYTVRLHFCELTWTAAGQRVFNVAINGNSYLSNFDIFATAGAENKAVVEQTTATANSSGQIVISFTQGSADNPEIAGIEVLH